jgi:hypothetical protein
MVMKRSSHRRAIRWILQELTRWRDQHSDPPLDQTRCVEGKPDTVRKSGDRILGRVFRRSVVAQETVEQHGKNHGA